MTGQFDDELSRRLAGLSADLDGVQLPGPSAARERAARRTRHQVTGGVLAGVAVVAAGVFVVSPSDISTTPEPAPPASLSTLAPDPTTTAPDLRAALLTPEDIAGDTGVAWAAADEPGPAIACDPAATLDTMSSILDREQAGFASAAGEVRQDLVLFADDTSAAGLADAVAGCLDEENADGPLAVVDTAPLTGVGDEGWITRYYMDPENQQATAAVVAIVRSRDVVSVTVQTEPTASTVGERELDLAVPVAAARRMCDVLFGDSCVSEPGIEDLPATDVTGGPTEGPTGEAEEAATGDPTDDAQAEPPADDPTTPAEDLLQLADDPFLIDDDVTAIGVYTGFTRRPDHDDPEPLAERCLDDLPAYGADPFLTMHYTSDLEGMLAEYVLRLPDAAAASQVVEAHTTRPDVCGEVAEQREETVSEPVDVDVEGADEAVTWTIDNQPTPDNPGSSGSFTGNGMARVGNVVVVVSFTAMGDPSGGDWSGVAAGLLATALDRAVG